jgi:hypothetical protein
MNKVWMALIAACVAFVITLFYFKRRLAFIMNLNSASGLSNNLYMYILGTLLNQGQYYNNNISNTFTDGFNYKFITGGYISCKITSIRIVVGAWCLLTLVLVNVYNGVLISYVTATHEAPQLINSASDVVAKSEIRLVVNRGQATDFIFSVCAVFK